MASFAVSPSAPLPYRRAMPLAQSYRPDAKIIELGDHFYDPVDAAVFPRCAPRFLNRRAAATIGLEDLSEDEWSLHLCRFRALPDNLQRPLALRYHGHQFRVYNPDLGDGRGFLFAQVRDQGGRLLDLGTKGSGQTPWSRGADGRLTLKGGVREILATEMLEALGVNTSKSLALFETGEELIRGDEPSPTRSAVLTRLSHGHIRIGSFQRQAFHGDTGNLNRLVGYSLEHLYGQAPTGGQAEDAMRLLVLAAQASATLAASYMAAGFVHGVLNSDNINITGESFDYGPWRFTPDWDPDFTAAYFDHHGLYAFGRQPEAIHWALAQLAGCLSLIADAGALSEAMAGWSALFEQALVGRLLERLGVESRGAKQDRALAAAVIAALESRAVTIDRLFFDWRGGRVPGAAAYGPEVFRTLESELAGRQREPAHDYWRDEQPCSMHIEEVEAIWAAIAENDDWAPFEAKVASVRRMGDAMREWRASA